MVLLFCSSTVFLDLCLALSQSWFRLISRIGASATHPPPKEAQECACSHTASPSNVLPFFSLALFKSSSAHIYSSSHLFDTPLYKYYNLIKNIPIYDANGPIGLHYSNETLNFKMLAICDSQKALMRIIPEVQKELLQMLLFESEMVLKHELRVCCAVCNVAFNWYMSHG